MNPEATDLCENLDAALFSSDSFHTTASVTEMREYLERWKRQIDTIAEQLDS